MSLNKNLQFSKTKKQKKKEELGVLAFKMCKHHNKKRDKIIGKVKTMKMMLFQNIFIIFVYKIMEN